VTSKKKWYPSCAFSGLQICCSYQKNSFCDFLDTFCEHFTAFTEKISCQYSSNLFYLIPRLIILSESVKYAGKNVHQWLGHVLLSSNTCFTKISIKGGLVLSLLVSSLILSAVAAKHCIKLDILATSLFYLVQFPT